MIVHINTSTFHSAAMLPIDIWKEEISLLKQVAQEKCTSMAVSEERFPVQTCEAGMISECESTSEVSQFFQDTHQPIKRHAEYPDPKRDI